MKVGQTLYVTTRRAWRSWLRKHHTTMNEIWLVFYKKHTGKPRIPYNDAVEEALCFGWIDSIAKSLDEDRSAQRFSPRRPTSVLSEMNRERILRLIAQKKMTAAGLAAIRHRFTPPASNTGRSRALSGFTIAPDILKTLKKDPETWKRFQRFPGAYKRIRIGWIEMARRRPEEFKKRLRYFARMTKQNKRFGMVQ